MISPLLCPILAISLLCLIDASQGAPMGWIEELKKMFNLYAVPSKPLKTTTTMKPTTTT